MLGKILKSQKKVSTEREKRFFDDTNVVCEEDSIGTKIQEWCRYCDSMCFQEILEKIGFQMPVTLQMSNDKMMINGKTEIRLKSLSRFVGSYQKHHIQRVDENESKEYSIEFLKDGGVAVQEEIITKKVGETKLRFFFPTIENYRVNRKRTYCIEHNDLLVEIFCGFDYEKNSQIKHHPELDEALLTAVDLPKFRNAKTLLRLYPEMLAGEVPEVVIYRTLLGFYPEIKKNRVVIKMSEISENSIETLWRVQRLNGTVEEIKKNTDAVSCCVRTDKTAYRYERDRTIVELKDGTLKVEIGDFAKNSSAYQAAIGWIENLCQEALNMNVF